MPRSFKATVVTALLFATVATSTQALESRIVRNRGIDYRVVAITPSTDVLELRWKDAGGKPIASIQQLRDESAGAGRHLLFASNAGIYDKSLRPLGLHVEDGDTLRPLNTFRGNAGSGNFSIQPNGVFWIDDRSEAGVMSTTRWKALPRATRIASQSGPMLVIDGAVNPAFDVESKSLKWRSGVCAATPDRVEFAVSLAPVTFHSFATLFLDKLHCRDALYLDGTLSRIWTAAEGYSGAPAFMVKPYVGIFAVFDNEKSDP